MPSGGSARTFARDREWRDDLAPFASAVDVDPASVRARYNLGVALKDAGDLHSCEDFKCTVNGDAVSCEDLKNALATYKCS